MNVMINIYLELLLRAIFSVFLLGMMMLNLHCELYSQAVISGILFLTICFLPVVFKKN